VPETSLPQILGHEFSAEVTAVGSEVKNVRPGDRCAVLPHVFCGTCYSVFAGVSRYAKIVFDRHKLAWEDLRSMQPFPPTSVCHFPTGFYEQGAILEPLATIVMASIV